METQPKQRAHLEDLFRAYATARKAHEAAQADEVWTSRKRREAEDALVDAMIAIPCTISSADGVTFSTRRQINISVTKENEDDVRGWLALTLGQDAAQDYLEVKVKRYAVERMVKEGLREGKDPESYPKFLKLYDRPRISVRGWDNEDPAPNNNNDKVKA